MALKWGSDNTGATGSSSVAFRRSSLKGVFFLAIDWKRFHVDRRILKETQTSFQFTDGLGNVADSVETDFSQAMYFKFSGHVVMSTSAMIVTRSVNKKQNAENIFLH